LKFEIQLENYKYKFEEFLERYIQELRGSVDEKLLNSMKYSLFSKGKRIRPILMLATYEMCGGKSKEIYKFAAALEMIHTYSLIHDDLPCMDNDTMRRGISCNHIKFGESTALLSGDALLTYAFEIASSCDCNELSAKNILRSIEVLSSNSGCKGMINGQCLDLEKNIVDKGKLIEIYNLKTSCLISAASEIGAVLSGTSEEKINSCKKYGKYIGLCFQIVDDILDNETYNLSFFKNPSAVDFVKELTEKAKFELKIFKSDVTFLEDFADFLMCRVC